MSELYWMIDVERSTDSDERWCWHIHLLDGPHADGGRGIGASIVGHMSYADKSSAKSAATNFIEKFSVNRRTKEPI